MYVARIGILTCTNATQDLGCSSVSCISDLRKRKGAFSEYPEDEALELVGIINCPGCPTLTGPEKLLKRIRALTEFKVDSIHFSFCVKALCPFREKFRKALEGAYPETRIVIGTHTEGVPPEVYREKVKELFSQERRTMVDVILKKNQAKKERSSER